MRASGFGEVARETWRDIRDGFSYIRRSELLLGTLGVTLAFNLLFPAYNAALPDIGQELLGVDKLRIGVLEALVGAGSFLQRAGDRGLEQLGAVWADLLRGDGLVRSLRDGHGAVALVSAVRC